MQFQYHTPSDTVPESVVAFSSECVLLSSLGTDELLASEMSTGGEVAFLPAVAAEVVVVTVTGSE